MDKFKFNPDFRLKAFSKAMDVDNSLDVKLERVNELKRDKLINASDYEQGTIISIDDADTAVIRRKDGSTFTTRFYTPLSEYMDAIEVDHKSNTGLSAIQGNKFKANQLDTLSKIFNKPKEEITNEDVNSLGLYQRDYVKHLLSKTSVGKPTPITAEKIAAHKGNVLNEIPVLFKNTGTKDKYGRELSELANPNTLENITDLLGTNPYTNSNFDLNKVRSNINKNREDLYKPLIELKKEQTFNNALINPIDTDSRLGENLDIIQASAYKFAGNLSNGILSLTGFGDVVDKAEASSALSTIRELSNPKTGQAFADALAGVSTETRDSFNKGLSDANNLWNQGKYFESILKSATQLDRVLADSAIQTGVLSLGAINPAVFAIGLGTVAAETTARQAELYKQNNGTDFTPEQLITAYGVNLALTVPEAILIRTGMDKLIKAPISNLIKRIPDNSNIFTMLKSVALGGTEETLQEYGEGVAETMITQNRANPKSFMKVLKDPNQIFEGVVGGLAGATTGGIAATPVVTVNAIIDNLASRRQKRVREYESTITPEGSNIDETIASEVRNRVKETTNNSKVTTLDDYNTKTNELEELALSEGISITDIKDIRQEQGKILTELVTNSTKEDLDSLENKEEALEKIVYYAKPNSQKAREDLEILGEKLGIDSDTVKNKLSDSNLESKYGNEGFITYKNTIKYAKQQYDNATTQEKKTEYSKIIDKTVNKLVNLKTSQAIALNRYNKALQTIIDNPSVKGLKVKNPDGSTIAINKLDIMDNSFDNNKGVYNHLNSIFNNIKEINTILKDEGIDTDNKVLNSLYKDLKSRISKVKALADPKEAPKTATIVESKPVNDLKEADSKALESAFKNMSWTKPKRHEDNSITTALPADTFKSIKEFSAYVSELEKILSTSTKKDNETLGQYADRINTEALKAIGKEIKITENYGSYNASIGKTITKAATNFVENKNKNAGIVYREAVRRYGIANVITTSEELKKSPEKNKKVISLLETSVNEYFDRLQENPSITLDLSRSTNNALRNIYDQHTKLTKAFKEPENTDTSTKLSKVGELLENRAKALVILEETREQIKEVRNNIITVNNKLKNKSLSKVERSALYAEKEWHLNNLKELNKINNKVYLNNVNRAITSIVDVANSIPNTYIKNTLSKSFLANIKNSKGHSITDLVKITNGASTLLGEAELEEVEYESIVKALAKAIDFPTRKVLMDRIKNESPAYALIFKDNGDTAEEAINGNVAYAIDYNVKDLFINMSNIINPITEDDMRTAWGLSDVDELNYTVVSTIRSNGVFRRTVADILGKSILSSLGITVNEDVASELEYNKLISNLGNIAIVYAQSLNWVTTSKVEVDGKPTLFVKSNLDGKSFRLIKQDLTLKEELISLERIKDKRPLPYPLQEKESYDVKKNLGITVANKSAVKALNKLRKTKYSINSELIDIVKANKEVIASYMGYTGEDELNSLMLDSKVAKEAKNEGINKNIEDLIELHEEGHNNWYFNWFFGRNGRFYIDSTHVNPQQDKHLQRWLVLPSSFEETIEVGNIELMNRFKYAIAQAFGYSGTSEQIYKFAEEVMITDYAELYEAFKTRTINKYGGSLKDVHVGQLLLALQSIQAYQNALDNNLNKFTNKLVYESDSTTSGYAIKILQFPLVNTDFEDLYSKIGINEKEELIHNLKKGDTNFFDLYETVAKNFKLPTKLPKRFRDNTEEDLNNYTFEEAEAIREEIEKFKKATKHIDAEAVYRAFKKVVPSLKTDLSNIKEVRAIFKNPTMIFGYGAGRTSVAYNLANSTIENIFNEYIKGNNKDIDNLINTIFENDDTFNKESLVNKLKSTPFKDVKIGSISITEAVAPIIAETYGKAVIDALETTFYPLVTKNTFLNNAFVAMFKIFDIEYRKATKGKTLSIKEDKELINNLLDKFPVIRMIYSESLKEGITIYDTDFEYFGKEGQAVVHYNKNMPFKESDNTTVTTNARIKKFISAVSSGAVVPIHFIDGAAMSTLINKYNIVPIHDAKISKLSESVESTLDYNEIIYEINKEYDLLDELTTRLESMVTEDNKHEKLLIYDKYKVFDLYGATKSEKIEYMSEITIEGFLSALKDTNDFNRAKRENFYNGRTTTRYIGNMDDIEGSMYKVSSTLEDKAKAFKEFASNTDILGAKPDFYTTEADYVRLNENSLTDKNTRLEILDRLYALNDNVSEEYFNHVKDLVGNINTTNLNDVIVYLNTNVAENTGGFDTEKRKIYLHVKDKISKPISYRDMTGIEIYTHELLHAVTSHVIENAQAYGKNKELRQLQHLQKIVMEHLLNNKDYWEVFLPNTLLDKKRDVEEAKALWKYIFNNDNIDKNVGLSEFVAHALSNPKLLSIVKDIKIKEEKQYTSLLDRLITVTKDFLNLFLGNKTFKEIAPNIANLFSGNISVNKTNITVYDSLKTLVDSISRADEKAIETLVEKNGIERLFNTLGSKIKKADDYVRPYMHKLINLADTFGIKAPPLKPEMTTYDDIKWLIRYLPLYAFSSDHRKMFPLLLRSMGFNYQGLVLNTYKDIVGNDRESDELEALGLISTKIDQSAKNLSYVAANNLRSSFNKELSESEAQSLTNALLKTDIQVLLDTMSLDKIKNLLENEESVNEEIDKIKTTIKSKYSKSDYNWYVNKSMLLGKYMVTGMGFESLSLNAYNIVSSKDELNTSNVSEEAVKLVDTLTTLYALKYTPNETKQLVAQLDNKGLENFIQVHRTFVNESKTDLFTSKHHIVKGYIKQLFDADINVKIGFASDSAKLAKEGFKAVKKITPVSVRKAKDLVLYKSTFNDVRHRNGAIFKFTGVHNIGTTLSDMVYADELYIDKFKFEEDKKNYIKPIEALRREQEKALKKALLDEEYANLTTEGLIPLLNTNGTVVDYRITMLHRDKEELLNQNLNGFDVLSKMYYSKFAKTASSPQNLKVFEMLLKDMQDNKVSEHNLIGLNKQLYIEISKNSHNEMAKELYRILPTDIKESINTSKYPLLVREDWLMQLFGVKEYSLSDLSFLSGENKSYFRMLIRFAEDILKHIAQITKLNIIMRTPTVLLGNIVSNINYSIMSGYSPITVLKMSLENAQNIRNYINDKKELEKILFKQRTNTASTKEINTINYYRARLKHNPVHPLMEKGMYQAIVEDMPLEELDATSRITKFMNKKFKNVPKPIKTITKHLYMLEGTLPYQIMVQATQYSDFVARATEYQLAMKNAPKRLKGESIKRYNKRFMEYEKTVSFNVLNAFINYDKPSSAIEQYVNDLGLMMFTKYAKRIQSVIANRVIENPVSVAIFLASQYTVTDTEDILSQNLFNKNYSALMHTPLDNFIDAITPSSYRLLKDGIE